jgi:hypothetical protein
VELYQKGLDPAVIGCIFDDVSAEFMKIDMIINIYTKFKAGCAQPLV